MYGRTVDREQSPVASDLRPVSDACGQCHWRAVTCGQLLAGSHVTDLHLCTRCGGTSQGYR